MADSLYTKSALAAAALLATVGFMAEAQTRNESPVLSGAAITADTAAIMSVMPSYEAALNASNTDAVMSLYNEDGVFMPPYSQSAVGAVAVRQVYDAGFKAITLHVKFSIPEVVEISPDWAFVRTNSAGTNMINATGARSAEHNHELFILKKGTDGTWKIARYS
jgi:uncharacterized protein (TIGR02246 family)